MPDRLLGYRNDTRRTSLTRASLVAVCVAGVVASITLHFQSGTIDHRQLLDMAASANQRAADPASGPQPFQASAPGDPSIPAASSVFAPNTPAVSEAPIAQF